MIWHDHENVEFYAWTVHRDLAPAREDHFPKRRKPDMAAFNTPEHAAHFVGADCYEIVARQRIVIALQPD